MKEEELRQEVLSRLSEIAPEIEVSDVEPDVEFREQFDIDSMDELNFIIALHESTGVDIPESDYPKLATLDGCVGYLASKIEALEVGPSG
jgi:acyl carrier protein